MKLKRDKRVGIFFSYNSEIARFLGYARFHGDQELSEAAIERLAVAGEFDGSNVNLGRSTRAKSESRQEKFCLEKDGLIIYGQECWYADETRTKRLLKNAKKVEEVDIEELRKKEKARQEALSDLTGSRVIHGFVQINVSFRMAHVREGEELEDLIVKQLLRAGKYDTTPFAGCLKDDIEVKVRQDDWHFCAIDESHGLATEVAYVKTRGKDLPLCLACYAEATGTTVEKLNTIRSKR
jgi:hypothetical protein